MNYLLSFANPTSLPGESKNPKNMRKVPDTIIFKNDETLISDNASAMAAFVRREYKNTPDNLEMLIVQGMDELTRPAPEYVPFTYPARVGNSYAIPLPHNPGNPAVLLTVVQP